MDERDQESIVSVLFDFSFTHFIVLKFVKLVFGILLIGDALLCLGLVVKAFDAGLGWGVLVLLFSPLCFIVVAVLVRVWTEMLVVLFRIAEDIEIIAKAHQTAALGKTESREPRES